MTILVVSSMSVGCAAARYDSAVGQPKERLLELVGSPTQIIRINDQGEVWVYPTSRLANTGLPLENEDTPGNAFQKGIAEGIAESIHDSIFLPGGPYRYVIIAADGTVESWETRMFAK